MAIHSKLPIYLKTQQLLQLVIELSRNFPRDLKNSLGGKLRDECCDLMVLIFRANCSREKAPLLLDLQERLEVVILILRVCKDLRAISTAQHSRTIELTDDIGRQANGWRKHSAASPAA